MKEWRGEEGRREVGREERSRSRLYCCMYMQHTHNVMHAEVHIGMCE